MNWSAFGFALFLLSGVLVFWIALPVAVAHYVEEWSGSGGLGMFCGALTIVFAVAVAVGLTADA